MKQTRKPYRPVQVLGGITFMLLIMTPHCRRQPAVSLHVISFHIVRQQTNNNNLRYKRRLGEYEYPTPVFPLPAPLKLLRTAENVNASSSPSSSTSNVKNMKKLDHESKDTTKGVNEMMTMSVVGTILTLGIIFILAGNGNDSSDEARVLLAASEDSDVAYDVVSASASSVKSSFQFFQGRFLESLEITGSNIIDAAVPLTASDLVSVTIGESIAGVIGASLSFILSNLFVGLVTNQQIQNTKTIDGDEQPNGNKFNNLFLTSTDNSQISSTTGFVRMSDAMADSDYIITNVAVKEILSSSMASVSPIVQTLIATSIAIIPYSIVKFNARKQQQKDELRQQLLLQQLMQEEERIRQQQRESVQLGNVWKQLQIALSIFRSNTRTISLDSRPNVTSTLFPSVSTSFLTSSTFQLDWVEIFADIVKWLQYDVLYADFGNGQLLGSIRIFRSFVAESMLSQEQYVSILVGTECAIFGIVTAVTSQMYTDVLYKYFRLGTDVKQEEINNRKALDWYAIYISKVIYCAILFGTYGALKDPTESIVMAVGSGGVDNCYGSINYQYCIDTFVANNPIGPTPEAQLRSLITAGISFWNNHNQWLSYLPFYVSS